MAITEEQRNIIEEGLKNFWPLSEICKIINRNNSTLYRYIQKNKDLLYYQSSEYKTKYQGEQGRIICNLECQIQELKATIKTLISLLEQKDIKAVNRYYGV